MTEQAPPPLGQRLRRWIAREATEEVAGQFYPWIRNALSDLGHDLNAPAFEEALRSVTAKMRRANVTPAQMQKALREARRAEEEGLSALEWTRDVQRRAHSEKLAEGAYRKAKTRLKEEFGVDEADLQRPPTPEETLAFLMAWEELGGTPTLAALREMIRRAEGAPSQN